MNNHIWNFSTVGGVKRVNIESGADLLHLAELDQKLWTALSCPVSGLEFDHKTLALVDTDNDGQIRVPEILAAVNWLVSVIKNPDDILNPKMVFPLSAINTDNEAGKTLYASAKTILRNLGKLDSDEITLEETADINRIFANSAFNGDGIVTTNSTQNDLLKGVIENIITCAGSKADRSGQNGVDKEQIDLFFNWCKQYHAWQQKAENNKTILPFGLNTNQAYDTFLAIKNKIDDYFIRCRLAAFDPQTTEVLNVLVERVSNISPKDLSTCMDEIAGYPLAKIEAGKSLELIQGINPAWEKTIQSFHQQIVLPLFSNQNHITENNWETIKATFEPYIQWMSEKEGNEVEQLGTARIYDLISNNYQIQLNELIEKDLAMATEANNIILVDQLVRYYHYLYTLLKNFVTFYDFYSPDTEAIFQAGTLYIDQRSCDLCIKVNDMDKHNAMAGYSDMFLMYCDCTSKTTNEKMTIVAALTNGDIDNLVIGRNAVFYDRNGMDWDATVVKIIDNPISIKQAFWAPYRKVSNFIEKQVNKFAAEEDSKVTASAHKSIEELPAKALTEQKAPPPPPFDIGKFVGIFAAISLALGAIGTAIASVISGFVALTWWKMPLAIAGLLLVISGPSMIMAYLKLRKRNLAPLLDANGWAINARATVNIQFGNTLTHLADLPAGAKVNLNDPFTKKKRPLLPYLILLSLIAGMIFYLLWKYGVIKIWM